MKHSYRATCACDRCTRERDRCAQRDRTVPEVMLDWSGSKNQRRARIAREYWDDFQSGRPMGPDDY
jgi:hypothetical protein